MNKHIHRAVGATALALPLALLGLSTAQAQGSSVTYTQNSRVEASGIVGALLSGAGGGEQTRGVHVLGSQLRTDEGSSSMIFDAQARQWTVLDHDARTYLTFTLEDMQQATAQLAEALEESREEVEAMREEIDAELAESRAELEAAMEEAQTTMDVSVQYLTSGQRLVIQGYQAEHHQIITQVEQAEGIRGAEDVEGGSLVILLDVWSSQELAAENPLYAGPGQSADNPFHEAMMNDPALQQLGEEMMSSMEPAAFGDGITSFASLDPRVGAALAEALESLAAIDGMPVRTTTIVAVVPPAVELDTALLLSWQPDSMGDQLRGQASEAALDAVASAARQALGGLTRGLFGGGGSSSDSEAEIDEEELTIRPLLRITNEVTSVQRGGSPGPEMFSVPEGYQAINITR